MAQLTRRASEWLALLNDPDAAVRRRFARILGSDSRPLRDHIRWYADVVTRFCQVYEPEAEVILVRAPGRINLVGMHIDHRGGYINAIACMEVVMVVQGREDDQVMLHNTDARFAPCRFRLSDEVPEEPIQDWERWTRQLAQERVRAGTAGHWSNYVKAPFVCLQDRQRGRRLKGMNAMVSGTIPQAAGLSSSSAVVVGALEACLYLNGLQMASDEFVNFCGIAEWYVGTRGGSGDHAAIKTSRQGYLSHIGFFPLRIEQAPFPPDYRVVVCNTGIKAQKAAGARDIFNQRVAAYQIGLMLIQQRFPQFASRLVHFRDLNPATLGVEEATIYVLLASLPETITRRELDEALPRQQDELQRIYGSHAEPPEGYLVRQVCLFGVSECQRSTMAMDRLMEHDIKGFGELMNLSHEGDRVSRLEGTRRVPVIRSLPDAQLDALAQDLRSGDPPRMERARLYRQPGGYLVSCPEGDEIVDIALEVDGVIGGRLVGAGLGGCVALLTRADRVDDLVGAVQDRYYVPRGLPPAVDVCTPIEGSGVLAI